jgi:putative ABC transport system permease protein
MFKNYLLTAFKVYTRRKVFTAINLACIVLTLVVLIIVAAVLQNAFHPRGVEGKSDRFLQIWTMSIRLGAEGYSVSPLGYKLIDKYLRPMKTAELVAAVTTTETVSVYQGTRVSVLALRHADANYWKVLDFTLLAGRLPNADDDSQGRAVVVLNRSSARQLFGSDLAPQATLGHKLNIGGQWFEVIGVVQDELHFNAYADLWVPISSYLSTQYQHELQGNFTALLLGRSAADLPAMRAEVAQIATTVRYPDEGRKASQTALWADSKLDAFSRTLLRNHFDADPGSSMVLTALVVVMLLFMMLPALNLVNLNMGRILERSAEIGVRKAFGATSRQLVAQLVLENVLLCLAGGALALMCSAAVMSWLEASAWIPYLKVHFQWPVFGYGLLITLIFGLLSGVIPAWRMSRMDPVHALKGAP